ncbi:MAG: hypothetical protein ACUVX8_10355 [Candidatus Zipacnadales bacterium]
MHRTPIHQFLALIVLALTGRINAQDGLTIAFQSLGMDLSDTHSLVILANRYPSPTVLTPSQVRRFERFVRTGERLYIEFARTEIGEDFFGISLKPEVRRAQYQRLYVTSPLHAISGLAPGDILEEHNSACLVPECLPETARVLLTYGAVIGTYSVKSVGIEYVVTVDLGEVHTVCSVSQRYGAGQPNYYPEQVQLWVGKNEEELEKV